MIGLTTDTVTVSVDDTIAIVTLNRPASLNAIDPNLRDDLSQAFDAIDSEPGIRAVLVSGAGDRAFCAGADLKHVAALEGADKRRFIESCWRLTDRVANCVLPVVAALHGHVLGGGLELALACDLRFASSDARFALPEIQLGSIPAFGGMQRLVRTVGVTAAADIAMTGRIFSAQEAQSFGLLNAITEPHQLTEFALHHARLIAKNRREPLTHLKAALYSEMDSRIAPLFHGLLSESMHRESAYQQATEKFRN